MIEAANTADLPALMALESYFDLAWSRASWQAELSGAGRYVIVARETSGVVAAACFQCVDGTVDLHRIVVEPAHRRRGLAAALIQAGLQWSADQGANCIMLEVNQHNTAAIELYRRYGFEQIAVRRNYYGQGADGLVMMRRLAPAPEGAQKKEVRA